MPLAKFSTILVWDRTASIAGGNNPRVEVLLTPKQVSQLPPLQIVIPRHAMADLEKPRQWPAWGFSLLIEAGNEEGLRVPSARGRMPKDGASRHQRQSPGFTAGDGQ